MIHLTLNGLIPSKKNSKQIIYVGKSTRIISSKLFLKWEKEAKNQILSQWKKNTLHKCSRIEICLFFGTKRKADITNKVESIMDLLVDCKVLIDDNYMVVPKLILSAAYEKNNPGAEIWIYL